MRGPRHDLRQLSRLASMPEDTLESSWRVALANLAKASTDLATPLEGLDPAALLRSIERVEAAGQLDSVDWMSPPMAAAALYQIASALPPSPQRTRLEAEVGRRLSNADAPTFVALATALAQSSQREFGTPRMRACVALCLGLPIGTQIRADGLALALISRPDLARTWLEEPSQGALPSRRMAARLLEVSTRAATKKLARGDESGLQVLDTPLVREAWQRLLDDRESLVWKHVAAARGLLSEVVPRYLEEMEKQIDPVLTPTEWRRAAASMAARIGVAPAEATEACKRILEGPVMQADPGVAAAMLLALPRAAEAQPDAVEPLLVPLLRAGGVYAIEAFVELLDEGFRPGFGEDAIQFARMGLHGVLKRPIPDDSQQALLSGLLERLEAPDPDDSHALLRTAQVRFAESGIASATPMALKALSIIDETAARTTQADLATPEGRRLALLGLVELEDNLLQSSALTDLLSLLGDEGEAARSLESVYDRLVQWLSHMPLPDDDRARITHPTLQIRSVRALLHLVDNEGCQGRPDQNRARRLRAVRGLLHEVAAQRPAVLRRALIASAARGCEALVREKSFEVSDVAIAAMVYLSEAPEMQALAEASMMRDLEASLFSVAELTRKGKEASDSAKGRLEVIQALGALIHALPDGHSPRTTALRQALLRVQRTLEPLQRTTSLHELVVNDGTTALDELIHALQTLAQLVNGARLRIDPDSHLEVPELGHVMQALSDALEQAVQGRDPSLLKAPLGDLFECAHRELPAPLAAALIRPLSALSTLPLSTRRGSIMHVRRVTRSSEAELGEANLPDWLPPNRTLGNFYVLHPIGEGGGGSVFVVRRSEERSDPGAEMLALKVPEYDGDAARALSEDDFMHMFREEAGALLALPQDQANLARFVTFDAGVRPKPILVMEYVEGPSLERLLARRHIDTAGAFDVLRGIANGLFAMHAMGVAHLDVKPSNVILRNFWSGAGLEPVLVDFGLTGRRLRPGCCTANYGAPEIWGEEPDSDPRAADIYAFGCLAYEVLTGKQLFASPSDMALISQHMMHDGMPEAIAELYDNLSLRPFAEWLTACLRKKPEARTDITGVLAQLDYLKPALEHQRWPIRAARKGRAQHA